MLRRHLIVLPVTLAAANSLARAGQVDLRLAATADTACVGTIIEIDVVLQSADGTPQPFDALDAVITWDPSVLQLIGSDQSNADVSFFLNGFLPDGDGVNVDLTDGDVIFTGLVSPGQTVQAPVTPGASVVTTLRFLALVAADPTVIGLPATIGAFGQSRVLLAGAPVTGTLGPDVDVTAIAPCTGDVNCDGAVDVNDLNDVVVQWGSFGGSADINDDGLVDVNDLVLVIVNWGECP